MAGSGISNGFSSPRKMLIRLPSFFWKFLELKALSLSLMAMFNSDKEKNCSFLNAAVIHVDMLPTDPSVTGLCLLSEITDNKGYRRKSVIGNLGI